jgi:hypothetical protein
MHVSVHAERSSVQVVSNRIDIEFGGMSLVISPDEKGRLKIHDTATNRLAVLPCAGNAFVVARCE